MIRKWGLIPSPLLLCNDTSSVFHEEIFSETNNIVELWFDSSKQIFILMVHINLEPRKCQVAHV